MIVTGEKTELETPKTSECIGLSLVGMMLAGAKPS